MKRILLSFLFLMAFLAGYSQMFNSGGTITVENGATLVIEGDYTSTSAGVLAIDGTVQLKGDFINNSGTVPDGSNGKLVFSGTSAQEITGTASTTFYCAVEVNNSTGVSLTNTATGNDQVFDSLLILTSGDLALNNFNATLNEGFSGGSAGSHIVTSGTGAVKAYVSGTNVTFPLGDGTVYNPVILNEAGTADTFAVQYANTHPGGWTGGLPHTVLGHWTVTEVTAGGGNLAVTPQWVSSQEQTSFDRTDCAVGVSTDNGATVAWKATSNAGGGNPYTQTGTGFTTVGKFMVADFWFGGIDLDLDVFLAGPLSGSVMTKTLNTSGLIPLTDPYGLGTTVASIPTDAVDWIKCELRDKNNRATILSSKAFFVDINGNVLHTDGNIGSKWMGIPKDQYYVAITHRNHLGIVSNNTVDLTGASPALNFSTAQSQAWQNPAVTTNAAMKLSGSIFALWNGNANNNGEVKYNGSGNDKNAILSVVGLTTPNNIVTAYSNADVNLNGEVKYNGSGNDKNIVLGVVGLTTPNNIIYRHLP